MLIALYKARFVQISSNRAYLSCLRPQTGYFAKLLHLIWDCLPSKLSTQGCCKAKDAYLALVHKKLTLNKNLLFVRNAIEHPIAVLDHRRARSSD